MNVNQIKKVVILAGGQGTRLGDVTKLTPKPLVPVGNDPIMVHIMRHFYRQGYKEFIIAVGYLSEEFKKYFRDYAFKNRNVVFTKYGYNIEDSDDVEDWKVSIIETGETTGTAGRLFKVKEYLKDEPFFLTYGDSMSNVDLHEVEKVHFANKETVATLTLASKMERFGVVEFDENENMVTSFKEKEQMPDSIINGGFIACDNELFDYLNEDSNDFSYDVLSKLSSENKIGGYQHKGFWSAMDTKQDHDRLQNLYKTNPELFGV